MFFTEKKVLVGFCLVSLFTLLSQSVTLAEWIPGGVSFVEASNTQSVGDLSAGEQLGDNRWEYRNPSPDLVQELESEQSLQPQTENSPDICWGCDGPWFTVPGYSDGIIETDPESGSKIIDQKNLEIDNELPAEIRRWVENSRDEFGGQSRLYDGKLYLLVTYGEKRTGGYDVEITEVTEQGEKLMVTADFTKPDEDSIVTQALTYPYDLIVIEETDLLVEFVATGDERGYLPDLGSELEPYSIPYLFPTPYQEPTPEPSPGPEKDPYPLPEFDIPSFQPEPSYPVPELAPKPDTDPITELPVLNIRQPFRGGVDGAISNTDRKTMGLNIEISTTESLKPGDSGELIVEVTPRSYWWWFTEQSVLSLTTSPSENLLMMEDPIPEVLIAFPSGDQWYDYGDYYDLVDIYNGLQWIGRAKLIASPAFLGIALEALSFFNDNYYSIFERDRYYGVTLSDYFQESTIMPVVLDVGSCQIQGFRITYPFTVTENLDSAIQLDMHISAGMESPGVPRNIYQYGVLRSIVIVDDPGSTPDTTSLSFTNLTPSKITADSAPFDAELNASGANFNNVDQIVFNWGGASTGGTATWNRDSSDWDQKVNIISDTSMILEPRVVGSTATWSGKDTWDVTLRDTTGATESRSFTVTRKMNEDTATPILKRPSKPTLISPVNHAEFDHFPRTTTLKWAPADGDVVDGYNLHIQTGNPRDQNQWWNGHIDKNKVYTDTEYTFNFGGMNPGRWRVRAVNEAETGKWTEWRYFRYLR